MNSTGSITNGGGTTCINGGGSRCIEGDGLGIHGGGSGG